jgi:hypothetical protein
MLVSRVKRCSLVSGENAVVKTLVVVSVSGADGQAMLALQAV